MAARGHGIPDDARARLSADFAGETYYEAVRQLEVLDLEPRVLRSVIHLAEGSLEDLRRYARVAEGDALRVVFWAEYEDHESASPRRVRRMDEPFATPRPGAGPGGGEP